MYISDNVYIRNHKGTLRGFPFIFSDMNENLKRIKGRQNM